MTGPSWLADCFAAIMIATSVYCLSRLAISRWWRRPTERGVDAVHVVMGVSMAGMLVPSLRLLPAGAWEAVFAVSAAWFGWQILRGWRAGAATGAGHWAGHHGQHLLASGAMLYMLMASRAVASTRSGGLGMGGGAATRFPTLALLFTLALLAYVILTTDRLGSLARVTAAGALAQPATGAASQLAGDAGAQAAPGESPLPEGPPSAKLGGSRAALQLPLSPRLSACCEIAMGVTMGYLLILMI